MKCLKLNAILLAILLMLGTVAKAAPTVSAKAAILLDAATGRALYEKNADEKSLIASTTKIMTALLCIEHASLQKKIQIPQQAVGVEGSSVYLQQGEELTMQELLYGVMLQSGNDAAVAAAIGACGSVETFVNAMNEKARALGLQNTHYANPNGLDDEQNYSTARELALLTRVALHNPVFASIASCKTAQISGGRQLVNHNKLLWRCDGCIGVKTGYTKAAGRILVSASVRSGRLLIAVTLGAPDDWNDHCRLYDFGFSQTVNGEE